MGRKYLRNLKGLATNHIYATLTELPLHCHAITIDAHKSKMSKLLYDETFLDTIYFQNNQ